MERKELLHNVQKTSFALVEVNLYLDSHPDCAEALEYFEKIKSENKMARKAYEEYCGPLTAASDNNDSWQWVKTPWPWEIGVN